MTELLWLHAVLVSAFVYTLYLGFRVTKKLYGGRFTSVLPPLMGAVALLFSIQIIKAIFQFLPMYESMSSGMFFLFSIQMLQLGAGLLLIQAVYKLYHLGFATSGFVEEK